MNKIVQGLKEFFNGLLTELILIGIIIDIFLIFKDIFPKYPAFAITFIYFIVLFMILSLVRGFFESLYKNKVRRWVLSIYFAIFIPASTYFINLFFDWD